MRLGPSLRFSLLLVVGAAHGLAEQPLRPPKTKVTQPSELPAHAYVIKGKPSDLVQNRDAMLALSLQVEKDLRADLETFDVQDKASQMSLYSTLYVIGMLKRDHASAHRYLSKYRELVDNPTQRLTIGLLTDPLMQALSAPGGDVHAAYRSLLTQKLSALPFKELQRPLEALQSAQKARSKEQIVGSLVTGLDPIVKNGQLNEDATGTILVSAMNLHVLLPVKDDVVACLDRLLEAHKSERSAGKPVKPPLGSTQIKAKGTFLGQSLPGETPVLFAPETLRAVSPWVSGIAFSPDGSECFLHVGSADYSGAHMYATSCIQGVWTELVEPAFLAEFTASSEPIYSQDGNTLTFTGSKGGGKMDFWTVNRTEKGWGVAQAMPSPINSEANEFRGSSTADGVLYFGSDRDSPGINQVFKAVRNAAQTWVVEHLGAPINALSYEGDPCVAPDGRFLITYSGRAGGFGGVDHYVSFSDGKGSWDKPINLGATFNGPDDEFGACLSHDGKTLFFTRHTAHGDRLFWVAVSAIDKLKP